MSMQEVQPPEIVHRDARGVARDARGRTLELPPALAAHAFKKGFAANPTGKGGAYHETLKLARDAAPRAIKRLAELMESEDERVAAVACNSLLDRAYGKAKEYDPKAEEPAHPPIDPSIFTPKQREMVRRALELLLKASETT